MPDIDPRTAQCLIDARRIFRRQAKHFRRQAAERRAWRDQRDGKLGAASDVRVIDVVSGAVVEIVNKNFNHQSS